MCGEPIIFFRPAAREPRGGVADGPLGAVERRRPEVAYNKGRVDAKGRKLPDGIELRFGAARPTREAREKLKVHGFRYSEKQSIWYARDTPKSREMVDSLEIEEIEVDTSVYEKHSFWARVKSMAEYDGLRGRVEFMVTGGGVQFFNGKKQLESQESPAALVQGQRLKFKRFYNKAVGEEGGGEPGGGEGRRPPASDAVDMEMIELEAEAELELMKMRAERERKAKKHGGGLGEAAVEMKLKALRQDAWLMADRSGIMDFN